MTKSNTKALAGAARRLERAKRSVIEARRDLAALTDPGHPNLIIPPEWRWADRLMRKRRPRLLEIPGVVGVGLGRRIRDGIPTDEPCVTVLVRRKYRKLTLAKRGIRPIPRYFRDKSGRRLPVDVVQLGRVSRQRRAGESLGPEQPPNQGTLGAVAVDDDTSARVGITAMHVTGFAHYPWPGGGAVPFCMPSRFADPSSQIVGELLRGTMTDIDAAKVRLDVPCRNFIPGIGPIQGWRPVTYPADVGTIVRMHGASSGFERGYIVNPSMDIPDERLVDALVVRIATLDGDSGAPLVDPSDLVIGFLVGEASSGYRLFTPVSLVLAMLECNIET